MSTWQERAQRGHRAVELHPDFSANDFETSASDIIADILHATADAGELDGGPQALLDRALRTFEGDAADTDDGPVLGTCTHGVDLDRAFCPEGCRV